MAAWCCDSGCDDVGMVQSLHDVQLLRQDACGIWGYGYVGRRPSVPPCCWRYPCALYNHLNLTTMIFFKQQILKPPTTGTSKNFGREVSKIWHAIHISISQPGLIWKNGNIAWHLIRYTSGIHIYIFIYIYIHNATFIWNFEQSCKGSTCHVGAETMRDFAHGKLLEKVILPCLISCSLVYLASENITFHKQPTLCWPEKQAPLAIIKTE